MKKAAVGLLAVVMGFAIVACSSGSGANGSDTAAGTSNDGKNVSGSNEGASGAEEQVTIRVHWWGSQTRHDRTLEVIKMFEEQHPNIKVQPEFSSFEEYWKKMAAEAAGGNLPDVMNQNFGEYLSQYTSRDLLYDLSEFIADGTIDTANISQDVLESGSVDGKPYAISLGTNAFGVVYNPQLIEQAGAKLPALGWTWNDYVDVAKKVAEVTDYGVNNLAMSDLDKFRAFEVMLRENGQQVFNDEATGLGFADDKVFVDFISMELDLIKAGAMPPMDVAAEYNKSLEDSLIVHGKVGMDMAWSNQMVALNKAAGGHLEMAPLPGPNEKLGMFLKPSMFFSIPKTSEHKKEAATFIDFFTNDVEANRILAAERGVPISSEVRQAIKPDLDEITQDTFDYIELVTANSSPIDNQPPIANEVITMIQEAFEKVLYEQMTPEEGAKEVQEKAKEIFGR